MKNLTLSEAFMERKYFSWYDYVLFSIMLGLSTLIGIYFGCSGGKQSTAKEYLLGGKTMKVFPISMSLIACHISGITVLAVPADVYKFGSNYSLALVGVAINGFLAAFVFVPVFYNLQITSTYEYLKLRFDTKTRILASFLFTLCMILYLPIVVYIPALAFAEVTSVNLYLVNPFICAICIFYTTIGGLKAVVWTDTLQFTAMIGAMLAIMYIGVTSVGGFLTVWDRSLAGGRLNLDFDINPTKRDTFWATVIGWTLNWIPHVGIGQGSVQKFLALPSLSDTRLAALIFVIGIIVCKCISIFTGLIIYAKYYDCDPFLSKQVTHNDQLLPHYIMDISSNIPGLPGLFIAGIFCAALSTLSAAMNSLAGTVYEDFVSRFMSKNITQKRVSQVLKLIVIIIGVIITSLVFVVEHLGSLLELSISFSGVTSGPLLGLFLLGMVFPVANTKGAFIGTISSLIFVSWIVIGAQVCKAKGMLKYTPKPSSIAGCKFVTNNSSYIDLRINPQEEEEVLFLYKITYYYYTLIGASVVLLIGLPLSWLTTKNNMSLNKNLITPWMHWSLPKNSEDGKTDNNVGGYPNVDNELNLKEIESMLQRSF